MLNFSSDGFRRQHKRCVDRQRKRWASQINGAEP